MRAVTDILDKTIYEKHQLEYFLAECSIDYLYFAEHVLGFQIGDYHKEWYRIFEKFSRVSLQAFRGSGKTNFVAGYLLWKALYKSKLSILIVSATFEQAKIVLKIIRDMISDNELLRQYIPEDKNATWKATELTLKNGSIFYSRTYGEAVKGLRIDYVLADEAGQYEDKSVFWVAISPVVQLNRGRIITIGTPTSHADLLHELEENPEYYAAKFPAEVDGKPMWPQKYTMAITDVYGRRSLPAVKKEVGELAYMQEFLLVPISSHNSLFPFEMIQKSLDNDGTFIQHGRIGEKYYVGADLAISETGDYTVFTVLHVNSDGKRVVYATRFRGSKEEQLKRLLEIVDRFRPMKILMDKTGLGETIFREFSQIIPNIEPLHFTAEEKYNLIMDLRFQFENLRISLPNSKNDINAYNYTQEVAKELTEFILAIGKQTKRLTFKSGKYDDCAISLALANKSSENSQGQVSVGFI